MCVEDQRLAHPESRLHALPVRLFGRIGIEQLGQAFELSVIDGVGRV